MHTYCYHYSPLRRAIFCFRNSKRALGSYQNKSPKAQFTFVVFINQKQAMKTITHLEYRKKEVRKAKQLVLFVLFLFIALGLNAQTYDAQVSHIDGFENGYRTVDHAFIDSAHIRCGITNIGTTFPMTGVKAVALIYKDGSLVDSMVETRTSITGFATETIDFGYYKHDCKDLSVFYQVSISETETTYRNNGTIVFPLVEAGELVRESAGPTTGWAIGIPGEWAKTLILPNATRLSGIKMLVPVDYVSTAGSELSANIYSSNADTAQNLLAKSSSFFIYTSHAGMWYEFYFDSGQVNFDAGEYWMAIEEHSYDDLYLAMNNSDYEFGKVKCRWDNPGFENWRDISAHDTRDIFVKPIFDSCQAIATTGTVSHEAWGDDGSIELNVDYNPNLYTVSWSNGATTQNISGLSPGEYIVTISNCYGCTHMDTFEVLPLATGMEETLVGNGLDLYPNPAKDILNLENKGDEQWETIEVYNLSGALLYSEPLTDEKKYSIDVSAFSSGMHILRISNARISISGSFIVE